MWCSLPLIKGLQYPGHREQEHGGDQLKRMSNGKQILINTLIMTDKYHKNNI